MASNTTTTTTTNTTESTTTATATTNANTNTSTTITPSIVLYTPRKNRSASFPLIQFLNQSGHHFTVQEGGGEQELVRRFGPSVLRTGGALGVLLADCLWLPYSDAHREYFEGQFKTFLVDLLMLQHDHHHHPPNDSNKPAPPACSNANPAAHSARQSSSANDAPQGASTAEIVVSPPLNPAPARHPIQPSLRKICAVPIGYFSAASSASGTVRSLNGWMEWSSSDRQYRRRRSNQPRGNIIIPQETPTQIMLRLSGAMDELCRPGGRGGGIAHADFLAFEEAVCELQATSFPEEPVAKVTFAINLHNLMVRHAMILSTAPPPDQKKTAKSRNDSNVTNNSSNNNNNNEDQSSWKWPNSLNEMDLFFSRIGYEVGGELISIQDLRLSLFGARQLPLLDSQPVAQRGRQRRRWFALCRHASGAVAADAWTEVFYSQPCIHTDVKVLFALAHGGVGNDRVETIRPESLERALNEAAERYCQTNVTVRDNGRVILPTLLSWYRMDLGHTPAKVMRSVQEYLSTQQRKAIGRSWAAGDLKVCFSSGQNADWTNRLVLAEADSISSSETTSGSTRTSSPRREPSRTHLQQQQLSPPKLSPRKSSIPQQSSSSPVKKTTEIKLTGRPPYHKKSPVRNVAGLPPIPSLQTSRPQASVGDLRVFSPSRGNGGGPNSSNMAPRTTALGLLVEQQEESNGNSHTADTTNSATAEEEEDDDFFPMEPGCNRRTMLLSDVSGITYGSDFDIRVSGRRWAPAPLSFNIGGPSN